VVFGLKRVQDLGQMVIELHVDHGAHDLAYMALGSYALGDPLLLLLGLGDHRRLAGHLGLPFLLMHSSQSLS
jgi:hypothetical protein